MKLWGGRFKQKPNQLAWEFNASINVDRRLAAQDVQGSLAWARSLRRAGTITKKEQAQIVEGLNKILVEFEKGQFTFEPTDEDIHTAVERRLHEMIGETAGKLHTGRSRNDQVATDFRLWLMAHIQYLDDALKDLQHIFIDRAEQDIEQVIPGYTHLQRAMPILLSHWWLSFLWPLQRDRQRLNELYARTAVLPLGSAALTGTSVPIDRDRLCEELGFLQPSPNSIDAVSNRDFAAEFLFIASLIGIHLSKLAESIVLFTSQEFKFFEDVLVGHRIQKNSPRKESFAISKK